MLKPNVSKTAEETQEKACLFGAVFAEFNNNVQSYFSLLSLGFLSHILLTKLIKRLTFNSVENH